MPSPFPGMDPYLESPAIWPDVHHELISQIRTALNPQLKPGYVARVELRVYISDDDDLGRRVLVPDVRLETTGKRNGTKRARTAAATAVIEPIELPFLLDEEIHEAFLEIRHVESESLVTVIEVLSPTNKIVGSRGRESLIAKRVQMAAANVHWVEIDVLREGEPTVNHPELKPSNYRILIVRGPPRRSRYYIPFSLRQALPAVDIPLRADDADVVLDLAAVFNAAYDNAAYELSIDYSKRPNPPLKGDDAKWAERLLRQKRLR